MQLTGEQFKQIQEALLSAFPRRDDLAMMVRVHLGMRLNDIAGGEDQSALIYNLLTWAESEGRLSDLMKGATSQVPGNPELQQLKHDAKNWVLTAPAPIASPQTQPATLIWRQPWVLASTLLLMLVVAGAAWFYLPQLWNMPEGRSAVITPTGESSAPGVALNRTADPAAESEQATAVPTLAPGVTRSVTLAAGVEMTFVYIPGGEFVMGSEDGNDNEQPRHAVALDAYWIGLTEVTNAQYAPFVKAGGYDDDQWWTEAGHQWRQKNNIEEPMYWNDGAWNDDLQPVVGISWYESYAYTQWLSAQIGLAIRLPSEAQWEKAARGTEGRTYPWGEEDPAHELANYSSLDATKPVGSYPDGDSPYGALDMAGNVWEWTSSLYVDYPYSADDDREDPDAVGRRAVRGGAWDDYMSDLRGATRNWDSPEDRGNYGGVRLVVLASPE